VSDRREHTEPEFTDFDDEAIDLALVHADDEYLDLLSGARTEDRDDELGGFGGFGDDQLTALLMSWRRDVDSEPIGDLVDSKLATVTVHASKMHRKRRPRLLVPLAAAAAVLAIAFAGVGLAARDAQPGDTLWALTKVLYADHARSVEAAEAVKADLREARAALTEGDIDEAKSKLEDAHATLPTVLPNDGKTDLEAEHRSLLAQLPGNPSGEAGQPPSPDPSTQAPDPGSSGGGGSSTDTSTSNPATDSTSPSTPPTDTTGPTSPTTSTETSRNEPGGTNSDPVDTNGTNGTNGVGVNSVDDPATAGN
jgi:hypothetical protein